MKPTRREFIRQSAIAGGALALGCGKPDARDAGRKSRASRASDDGRPNILLFLVDQERQPRHTRPIATPNRDRLKKHVIEYTNAHCTYPQCSPSRATLMTGRYPHEAGVLHNCDFLARNPDMPAHIPTLGLVLSDNGYRTAYFGKWHLSGFTKGRNIPEKYGFDEASVSNQIVALGSDDFYARKTGKFIRREKGKGPWFAVFSPINPHDICYPGLRHYYAKPGDRAGRDAKLPPNFSETRSLACRTAREHTVDWGDMTEPLRGPYTRNYYREYIEFYCSLIEEVDRNLGTVLDAVEESGQWDNTVIIYTSDHGEMAGSHGFQNKGPTMYDETMNIPLMISWPGKIKGHVKSNSLVSNLDMVPTICSLSGAEWPEKIHGRSLLTPAGKDVSGAHDHIFAEGGTVPAAYWRGIRTPEWKYWHYVETGEEMLFNEKEDPLEIRNLSGDRGHAKRLNEFRGMVRSWRKGTGDPVRKFLG